MITGKRNLLEGKIEGRVAARKTHQGEPPPTTFTEVFLRGRKPL